MTLPFAGAIALASLLALPFGGAARAAFTGYNGASADVIYNVGTAVQSTGGFPSMGGPLTGTDPAWRPDGGKVAYVSGNDIFVADANGSGRHALNLGDGTSPASAPAWNEDGSKLAYVKGLTPSRQIWTATVSADASTAIPELNRSQSGTDDVDPAWSPDDEIAFVRTAATGPFTGTQAIFVMAADGSGQLQVTTFGFADGHPAWSPGGSTIAFDSTRDAPAPVPPALPTRQIYEVSPSGGNPTRLTNATSDDFEPTYSPEGDQIAFVRGATGIVTMPAGGGTVSSPLSGTSGGMNPDWHSQAPLNLSAPTISGSTQVGATLFASQGSWRGADPSKFTYQWSQCSGGSCSAISSATSSSYTLTGADQGKTLKVTVTARNAGAPTTATISDPGVSAKESAETGFVGGEGPLILTLPQIIVGFGSLEGAPTIGFSVFATTGTWKSELPLTFKYQWRKCERNNGPCSDIPGATFSSLLVTGDLVGRELVIAVTAHNDKGDTYIESQRSLAVTGLAPHALGTPPITGTNEVGQTLNVTGGLWSTVGGRAPTSFIFEWRRCDAFGNLPSCVPIAGATTTSLTSFGTSSYRLTEADIDKTIRVYITGRNSVGSETIITNHTFPTLPKRKFVPSPAEPPSIKGEAHPGQKLVVDLGTWGGDTPISYTVFWRRCDATAANCRTLNTRGRQTYVLKRADLGHTLVAVVNATNQAGTSQALTAPTPPVTLLPKRKKGRRIVGTNRSDYIAGGAFDDTLIGRGGNDTINGGAGNDRIDGGPGNDVLDGGRGVDTVLGGTGSDTIVATDGEKDEIDCGAGNDRAFVDADDSVKGCEVVSYSTPPTATP